MPPRCPCQGDTLDRLLQPAVLVCLARQPRNGYQLRQALAAGPLFRSRAPDVTGLYRTLKQMERRGVLASRRQRSAAGPESRVFELTDAGRVCLGRWMDTLRQHRDSISRLLALAARAPAARRASRA